MLLEFAKREGGERVAHVTFDVTSSPPQIVDRASKIVDLIAVGGASPPEGRGFATEGEGLRQRGARLPLV